MSDLQWIAFVVTVTLPLIAGAVCLSAIYLERIAKTMKKDAKS